VIRSYAYRLYPTKAQTAALERALETHRQLYNAALQERRDAWRLCHKSINYYDQANQLKAIRQFDEDAAWLNYSSIQQTLRRLDRAFAAFFRRVRAGQAPGYPRFKSKRRFNSVEYRWGDGARFKDKRLHIHGAGAIKVKWHRAIPETAKVKCVYLKRNLRQWYAIFSLELPDPEPCRHPGPEIGIDLGLNHLVALSNGVMIENPRYFRTAQDKLAERQRALCRKVKYSHGWRKQAFQVAKAHQHIANQRRDHAHTLARHLADSYSLIAVEVLNVAGMAQGHLAKSILDAGWSQLVNFTTYKAESAGGRVVAVSAYRSSQACSGCGEIVPKDLSVRVHVCPRCGRVLDRDTNAAINHLRRAHLRLGLSRGGHDNCRPEAPAPCAGE
jgi:putative transposase